MLKTVLNTGLKPEKYEPIPSPSKSYRLGNFIPFVTHLLSPQPRVSSSKFALSLFSNYGG